MGALAFAWLLDLIIGDPYWIPHPVRWMGRLTGFLEHHLNDSKKNGNVLRIRGLIIVVTVVSLSALICGPVIIGAYRISMIMGAMVEAVISCYMLSCKCLYTESMKVYHALIQGDLKSAVKAVSMIVGRDTEKLDSKGVIRAAVETVAENTSDGVVAPLFYLAIGGPVFGVIYKSVNTMDSMIGYRDEKYRNIGYFAAKLDDILNFIPSRISALIMIIAAFTGGRDLDHKNAFRIFIRDRYKHESPNSAQCESVCAGALGIRLAGPASYFGKTVEKQYIGDNLREPETEDIKRANRLMLLTSLMAFVLFEVMILMTWGSE